MKGELERAVSGEAIAAAARMAAAGGHPVVRLRAGELPGLSDRILTEVCRKRLPVVFVVDCGVPAGEEAGLQAGTYAYFRFLTLPDLCLMTAQNGKELAGMLSFALALDGPAAICYEDDPPGGEAEERCAPISLGKAEILYDECEIALLAAGSMVRIAREVRGRLRDLGYSCSLLNLRFVNPLDEAALARAAEEHRLLVTLEQHVRTGGLGDRVLEYLNDTGARVRVIQAALPEDWEWAGAGDAEAVRREACIDADSVFRRVVAEYVGMSREGQTR